MEKTVLKKPVRSYDLTGLYEFLSEPYVLLPGVLDLSLRSREAGDRYTEG